MLEGTKLSKVMTYGKVLPPINSFKQFKKHLNK